MGYQAEVSPAFTDESSQGSTQQAIPSMLAKRQPPRSYEKQLNLDGQTARGQVKKKIMALKANGKWAGWTPDTQRKYIADELDLALIYREAGQATTTVRVEYPEIWQRKGEETMQRWVRTLVEAVATLGVSSSQACSQAMHEDRDDEERYPSAQRVKAEQESDVTQTFANKSNTIMGTKRKHNFAEDSDDESELSELESEDEGEKKIVEYGKKGKKKSLGKQGQYSKSIACGRGLAMKLSVEGESKGSVEGGPKRYWKWDDVMADFVELPAF